MTGMKAARAATIAIVIALGAYGLARPEAVLTGGVAWLAFLMFVLSGWGWLAVRIVRVPDADFGLRAAWGIAALLAITGVLVMLSLCARAELLALIAVGVAGFAWREWTTDEPLVVLARRGLGELRARPLLGYIAILIGAIAVLRMVGGVVQLDRNPWDDDVAYTPLVKRILDAGSLVEPYSFRRLGAYGGQSMLQAVVAARGSLQNVHLFDQALSFGLVMLLLVGYARALRRVPGFWLAVLAIAVLVMPDTSINTASYWSGAVVFLALYRTVVRGELVMAALVGAGACTLRQNYIPVVVLFLAFTLAVQLAREARAASWREAWRAQRRTTALVLAVAAAALISWCVAAFESNRTFLFPFMQGTWNHGLTLNPTGWSWVDRLSFYIWCCLDTQPIVVVPVLFALVAFAKDARAARPIHCLLVASTLGVLLLADSFRGTDAYSIWRYGFGYALTIALAFALEVANDADDNPVQLPALGKWTLLAALLVQIAFARIGVTKHWEGVFADLHEAVAIDRHGDPNARAEARHYAALQAAIPAGARVAALLDDPVFLDYRRNEIFNLDTPGYASPEPQLPVFAGAESVRAYFLGQGIRYLAFVREDHSRYFYRREFWVWRVFTDNEIFQVMSAYMIAAIDAFAELARTSSVIYEGDGMVVLDLGDPGAPHAEPPRLDPKREPEVREAFVRAVADREHLHTAWDLNTRHDVVFEDGLAAMGFIDYDAEIDPRWFEIFESDPKPRAGMPVRWVGRRVHVRLRGDTDMHLAIRGRIARNTVYTRPRIDVSLDGDLLTSVTVDDAGGFVIDLTVPKDKLDGWADLYLVFNTIGQPDRDVTVRIARFEDFVWEPR